MKKAKKKRAPTPMYVSPTQLSLGCFKTPFEQHLNFKNRWVVLATLIPWDEVLYDKRLVVRDKNPQFPKVCRLATVSTKGRGFAENRIERRRPWP